MYQGSYERNFENFKPGATHFEGADGESNPIPAWPGSADGVRIGYMEKAGKKFFIVRVQYGDADVVLRNPLVIDLARYFGYGKRLGPEPTLIEDDALIVTLLEDVLRKNPEQSNELLPVRAALKGGSKKP
jgi:hypothetical protein